MIVKWGASKFSLLPFGIISTKSTFKLSPSKFCQNRWRPTPSTCLTTKNKTHRFFWSKTKLSNYTPILYTASHFFIFLKCCNMVHIFTLSYIKIIVVNFNYYKFCFSYSVCIHDDKLGFLSFLMTWQTSLTILKTSNYTNDKSRRLDFDI